MGPNKFIVRATTNTPPTVSMDYNFTVTRLADVDSTDATLSALTLTGVEALAPTFDAKTRVGYIAVVGKTVVETTVAATATDSDEATVVITPEDANDDTGGHQVSLESGPNVIKIVVTAEDGTTKLTYEVTVTRTPLSTDSTLSALSLEVGEDDVLDPPFTSDETSYDADVASTVTTVTLTATSSAGELATIVVTLFGGTLTGDQGVYEVATPSTTTYPIRVTVTAEDDSTTTVYEIDLTKAE